MKWTDEQLKYIIAELADENPMACRALFQIVNVRFTEDVPTLAVTLSSHPELLINKTFCNEHLNTEDDVKAVLLHEFLHILLGHTVKYDVNSPLLNLALDAIINSIIHRTYGYQYSQFFERYYSPEGLQVLLRPYFPACKDEGIKSLTGLHRQIYDGRICGDDLFEVIKYMIRDDLKNASLSQVLIGDHGGNKTVSGSNGNLLDEISAKLKWTLIWKKGGIGVGNENSVERRQVQRAKALRWRVFTRKILQRCLRPDPQRKSEELMQDLLIPVLNPSDKRALAKFYAFEHLPLAANARIAEVPGESVSIYLDVSGSMNAELKELISLLHIFRQHIKLPIWVFSDDVYPAKFIKGELVYSTSYGTRIDCVFSHMAKHRINRALIVTDGEVKDINNSTLMGIDPNKIDVIISAEGRTDKFKECGIRYHQLKQL